MNITGIKQQVKGALFIHLVSAAQVEKSRQRRTVRQIGGALFVNKTVENFIDFSARAFNLIGQDRSIDSGDPMDSSQVDNTKGSL